MSRSTMWARLLLVRRGAEAAVMAGGLASLAIIGVGADEHAPALVVGHDLIEIGIFRGAQRARRVEAIGFEGMVLEVERHDLGIGRDRIDALLATGAEQLQRRAIVHLGIVEFRR